MLNEGHIYTALPVRDLDRARAFYLEKLGLEPTANNPGGLLYRLEGGGEFLLYPSGHLPGGHTQANITVSDVAALVKDLKSRGVVFEDYDMPGLKTVDGVVVSGPHTSAWFKDSEGNLVGLMQTGRQTQG
ncbi:MAG TPA: VOC family protein [Candidatus Dormibacteraeota bacterium]|nr:VOC family protein [Candidatus Dormibacteraeota bacterium]